MKTFSPILRLLATVAAAFALAACGGNSSSNNVAISGTITGLTADNLILYNSGFTVAVPANATSFVFSTRFLSNTSYNVSVSRQPTDQTCTVTNGSGITGGSDITNVQVACVPNRLLGGTVTGLTGSGLVLANGSDTVAVAAGSASFTFPTRVGKGFPYGVTVLTQPAGQTCAVSNGVGTVADADIASVQVSCS